MTDATDMPRVVAVDDDPSFLLLLDRTLSRHGMTVSTHTTAEAALVDAETSMPDAVLLDIHMPDVDGFETCRRLKSDPRTRDIPILFMSAQARSEGHVARLYSAGACGYITKPLSRVDAIARVRSVIERQHEMTYVKRLRMYDSLTGLPDHRYFRSRADDEVSESVRYRTPVTVIVADLDRFQQLNEERGTDAGDAVLQRFAGLLRWEARRHDLVARWKSATFTLLLPRIPSEGGSAAARRMNRIWQLCAVPVENGSVQSTASFGVASGVPKLATATARDLIDRAERALQSAKSGGGDAVVTDAPPGDTVASSLGSGAWARQTNLSLPIA